VATATNTPLRGAPEWLLNQDPLVDAASAP
jgi:hypothetical protein